MAVVASTKKHGIRSEGFTDECNLSNVGPGAAVGTTSHTHDDGVVTEPVLLTYLLDLVNEDWKVLDTSRKMALNEELLKSTYTF